jgi:hypothetical protein
VEGQLGETFIQFSDVELMVKPDSKIGTYRAIFLIATFNKNFKGDYFVFSGSHSSPHADFTEVKKITLEDPDFNKAFTFYGSDEVEGRYILTPSMMQKMLDFRAKVQDTVNFSFTRSRMFIGFGTRGYLLFDPDLSRPIDYASLAFWDSYLRLIIGVVEEFQLNTRIWSKK